MYVLERSPLQGRESRSSKDEYYQVEAYFTRRDIWQRNQQKHYDIEKAKNAAEVFEGYKNISDTRVVKIKSTLKEKIVS